MARLLGYRWIGQVRQRGAAVCTSVAGAARICHLPPGVRCLRIPCRDWQLTRLPHDLRAHGPVAAPTTHGAGPRAPRLCQKESIDALPAFGLVPIVLTTSAFAQMGVPLAIADRNISFTEGAYSASLTAARTSSLFTLPGGPDHLYACGFYYQYGALGDEDGNLAILQKLRAELLALAPDVQV